MVYYGHNGSVVGELDPDFGVSVKWDRPLMDGYPSVILSRRHVPQQRSGLRTLGIIPALIRGRYDAVFIHSYGTFLSLAAYIGAWLSRTPVLLRTESELIRVRSRAVSLAKRIFLSVLFRGTSAFLVIGEANRRFYRSFWLPDHQLFDTLYAVDNQFFREQARQIQKPKPQLKRELNLPPEAPIICFSGKFIERKRPLDLLRAYADLCRRGHRASLLLVGDGPLRGELEGFVEQESLSNVRFVGFCNQTELSTHYAASDMFVLPARFETWGLVVNEAMLFSLPVAVTENVGCRFDLVTPGETGAVFRVADVAALTDILTAWITDPVERERIGVAGAARVARYNQEACVAGILAALHHVVTSRPRESAPALL